MKDYNAMLIDLLNDKIERLVNEKIAMKKEIARLKSEIRKLQKEMQADEK